MREPLERREVEPEKGTSPKSYETHKSEPQYGATITKQIEKEALERQYSLNGFPNLLTTEMKLILGSCELMIVITLVAASLWSYFFGGLSTDLHNFGGERLCFHVMIFVFVNTALIPHIIIGSILLARVNPTLKFVCMMSLKAFIIGITIAVGAESAVYVQNTKNNESQPAGKDDTEVPITIYNTHDTVVSMISIVEIVYIVTTVSSFLSNFFPALYDIRIVGRILSIISRPWFMEPLEELFNISGCIGILSGFHAYMSYSWNKTALVEEHDLSEDNFYEGVAIVTIIICNVILCSLVIQANRLSHFLRNHKDQITEREFVDNFLQFRDVFHGDVILREEDPKIDPVNADRMN